MKSEVKANLFKESGNEFYLKSQFPAALTEYNKSLCHAESKELKSLLYGNRSAIYFKVKRYKMCLENIQSAKKLGYPQDKLSKLQEREQKCYQFLSAGEVSKEDDQKVAEFFKLSYKTHPKIPFIINGIELRNSKKYGNHLITNRDLKTGDIIAIESFSTHFGAMFHERCFERCAFCLSHNFYSLIPCDGCSKNMYCSESCKLQHKKISHGDLCLPFASKFLSETDETCQRVVTTVVKEFGCVHKLNKILKNPKKLTIFAVDDLSTKNLLSIFASMPQAENRKREFIHYCETNPSLVFKSPSEKDFFLHFLAIHVTNSIVFDRWEYSEVVKGSAPGRIGNSICAFGSMFNHSCNPNINRMTLDNKMVFIVNRPIKAGEQLFLSYGSSYEMMPLNKRREVLMKCFNFRCDCDACKKNYPLLNDLRSCNKMCVFPALPQTPTVDQFIEAFKKNCEIIDKLHREHPCYETTFLITYNANIINQIPIIRL